MWVSMQYVCVLLHKPLLIVTLVSGHIQWYLEAVFAWDAHVLTTVLGR